MMNTRWFFILVLLFPLGCRQQSTDDRRIDQLADTYADVVVCKTNNAGIDSAGYQKKLGAVFKKHGYTKEQFQQEIDALCAAPEQFHAFSDLALKKIQQHKP